MNSHVGRQVVLVLGAETATGAVEPLGRFMDKQMGAKTAFVIKFFITFVTMKDFVRVQDFMKFHAMHGSGLEIAAFSRAMEQSFLGMDIVMVQQDL